jgi:hypothetical protein
MFDLKLEGVRRNRRTPFVAATHRTSQTTWDPTGTGVEGQHYLQVL